MAISRPPSLLFLRTRPFHPRRPLIRTLIAAPKPGDGPLLERRSDRALPSIRPSRTWLKTIPIFVGLLTISALSIFNYQKSSSPVVSSALYALRTSAKAREYLGDEIYFASQIPWIKGEMNQLHGRVNITFWVKGTRNEAKMRFKCARERRSGTMTTQDWSLETADGQIIQLLESERDDPMKKAPL